VAGIFPGHKFNSRPALNTGSAEMIADSWIERIRGLLELSSSQKEEVLCELSTHLEEEVEELERGGLSGEEASIKVVEALGSTEEIARELNQVYAHGSDKEAILASLPYFLSFLLFSLGLEENMGALIFAGGTVIVAVLVGRTARSPWVLTWMGYSFVLLFALGFLLWDIIFPLALAYGLLVISLFITKVISVVREDSYLIPLISVPPLIFGEWFLEGTPEFKPLTVLGFLALAVLCSIFIMGGRRAKLIVCLTQIFVLSLILGSVGTAGLWALPAITMACLVLREARVEQH